MKVIIENDDDIYVLEQMLKQVEPDVGMMIQIVNETGHDIDLKLED